jgi:hypothetical protein
MLELPSRFRDSSKSAKTCRMIATVIAGDRAAALERAEAFAPFLRSAAVACPEVAQA